MKNKNISFKGVVDKTSNRVVFVESDEKFVDILFSFLTLPLGTIVRVTHNRSPRRSIGCLNNLYKSIEILDKRYLRTEECKTMLLYPRNGANAQCKNLKLEIRDGEPLRYFLCSNAHCSWSGYKLLSHYMNVNCGCGKPMNYEMDLTENKPRRTGFDDQDGGVFVKGPIQLTISDELQVMPSSTPASLALFSKLGIKDTSTIEERIFSMGELEALKLLKCLLVSKIPLTEALLEQVNPVLSPNNVEDVERVSFRKVKMEEAASNEGEKIHIKLMVSKSKNMVCCAEADEKFVDLLFSFLTFPLGFLVKEMGEGSSEACINHLYNSIQDLDACQCLVCKENAAMLLNPKLAPGFSYETQPLNIEEYKHQPYYCTGTGWNPRGLTSDETLTGFGAHSAYSVLTVMDPKSNYNDNSSGRGFLKGPAIFTITDDLTITPLSSVTGLSALRELRVPFSDIEERTVHVGKEEASRLLVVSFVSKSALTNTFLSG